ncbi:YccF domain-containing protein [Acidihalobacter prosperus]
MRDLLRLIGNLLWLLFGGLLMALAWWLAAIVMIVTIIGIPWARAAFVIGRFTLWPFGYRVAERRELFGRSDLGSGPLGTLGNIVWFLLAGLWLGLGHLFAALACFVTIIGIPFGLQHLKLAQLSLFPIGKTIVPIDSHSL